MGVFWPIRVFFGFLIFFSLTLVLLSLYKVVVRQQEGTYVILYDMLSVNNVLTNNEVYIYACAIDMCYMYVLQNTNRNNYTIFTNKLRVHIFRPVWMSRHQMTHISKFVGSIPCLERLKPCLTKYKAYIAPSEDEQTTNNTNSKVRWLGPWAGRASVIPWNTVTSPETLLNGYSSVTTTLYNTPPHSQSY